MEGEYIFMIFSVYVGHDKKNNYMLDFTPDETDSRSPN